jgi:hypothetical protein
MLTERKRRTREPAAAEICTTPTSSAGVFTVPNRVGCHRVRGKRTRRDFKGHLIKCLYNRARKGATLKREKKPVLFHIYADTKAELQKLAKQNERSLSAELRVAANEHLKAAAN